LNDDVVSGEDLRRPVKVVPTVLKVPDLVQLRIVIFRLFVRRRRLRREKKFRLFKSNRGADKVKIKVLFYADF
jgi:hypothetical protein